VTVDVDRTFALFCIGTNWQLLAETKMAASKQMRCWIILPPLLVLFTIFAIKKSSRLIHLDEYKNHLFVDNGEKNVKLSQKKDNVQQKSRMEIPNYFEPKLPQDKLAFWELNVRDGKINCQIHAHAHPMRMLSLNDEIKSIKSDKEQYVIHIHGLHHTGTGYLRQTIQNALNDEFAIDLNSPVASVQNGSFPYLRGLSSTRRYAPENEGQHFQNVFPPNRQRKKTFIEADCPQSDFGKLAYLADECKFDNSQSKLELGNVLFNEWSPYWNMSATFLIQKTPTLDVHFLERTKVLPTLHVMIIRHPMTSNSPGRKWMGLGWLDAWAHTLEVLASGEIEWYAVVPYEALVQYHEVVVREMLEVLRSGILRLGDDFQINGRAALTKPLETCGSNNRRLELHASNSTVTFLTPKSASISLWKTCNTDQKCNTFLKQLTSDIFPSFGYVDVTDSGEHKDELTSNPGTKGISRDFGHVLFSSEGDALKKFKESCENKENDQEGIGYEPSMELIHAMKELLRNDNSPLKGRIHDKE